MQMLWGKLVVLIKRALKGVMLKTCMVAFNTSFRPILEYASLVRSPYNAGLIKEDVRSDGLIDWQKWRVSDAMEKHGIVTLAERRHDLDIQYLRRVESAGYGVNLRDYLSFDSTHNT